MNLTLLLSTISGCSLGAVVFLRLAQKYGLHDHPNGRSSHRQPTVTGMGIIVVLGFLIYLLWQPFELQANFVIGFLLLTTISFIDDIYFLKHSFRLFFQVLAMAFMVLQLPFQSSGLEAMVLGSAAVIFGVGVLNAYNFMDGVNGMLTLHALLVLGCLLYLNETLTDAAGQAIQFTNSNFIIAIIVPMAIFGFFNFRKHALAFIGDVGSIGIAFITVYLMYSLLLHTGNYTYLLLFCIFGADAGLTVIYKLILRENIFVPHRDFLFKKMAHIARVPHLSISIYYFLAQLVINLLVLFAFPKTPKLSTQMALLFIIVVAMVAVYIYFQNEFARRKSGRQK
ncbi:MAG: UDP-GlcNAc--UDP-phosphate GlcNAc-1-phosphate transferase [Bacteroidetes bacterium]|nr:UDP-GlcNAc--UDP-phosphate GlcNAc-1-phosphate transferase [Bacteroidota bacterium]